MVSQVAILFNITSATIFGVSLSLQIIPITSALNLNAYKSNLAISGNNEGFELTSDPDKDSHHTDTSQILPSLSGNL